MSSSADRTSEERENSRQHAAMHMDEPSGAGVVAGAAGGGGAAVAGSSTRFHSRESSAHHHQEQEQQQQQPDHRKRSADTMASPPSPPPLPPRVSSVRQPVAPLPAPNVKPATAVISGTSTSSSAIPQSQRKPPPPQHHHYQQRPSSSASDQSPSHRNASSTGSHSHSITNPKQQSKAYKGLRHFSLMVCKKVEEKGTTSYNEVADELVKAIVQEKQRSEGPVTRPKFDEKNIRRRVYDALNVLKAMDILETDKKEIVWKGLPTSAAQDLDMLTREVAVRGAEVERKRDMVQELLTQQVCFHNLVQYNHKRRPENTITTTSSSSSSTKTTTSSKTNTTNTASGTEATRDDGGSSRSSGAEQTVPLPFIIVNTSTDAILQCNMSRDRTDVMFDFSMPFEINDDNTILKRLGLHKCRREVLNELLPRDMMQYCLQHNMLDQILEEDLPQSMA